MFVGAPAAAVVPLARVALGVLVRRDGADGLEHARPREVLGGDQLDLGALALELPPQELRDLRVDLVEARGAQLIDRLGRDGHVDSSPVVPGGSYSARQATTARAASPSPATTRATTGFGPAKSTTADGMPGS